MSIIINNYQGELGIRHLLGPATWLFTGLTWPAIIVTRLNSGFKIISDLTESKDFRLKFLCLYNRFYWWNALSLSNNAKKQKCMYDFWNLANWSLQHPTNEHGWNRDNPVHYTLVSHIATFESILMKHSGQMWKKMTYNREIIWHESRKQKIQFAGICE